MGNKRLERALLAAEQNVIRTDRDIAAQRSRIGDLSAQGLDASEARALLQSCKDRQREHLAMRTSLRATLARRRQRCS